jgi:hypothetical protein
VVRFLADEDIPRAIVRGVKRRKSHLDIVRVQDVGLRTREDPEILEWAATQGRVVISRDKSSMPDHAAERIRQGKAMPGLLLVHRHWRMHVRRIIEDIIRLDERTTPEEWEHQILYLPL